MMDHVDERSHREIHQIFSLHRVRLLGEVRYRISYRMTKSELEIATAFNLSREQMIAATTNPVYSRTLALRK